MTPSRRCRPFGTPRSQTYYHKLGRQPQNEPNAGTAATTAPKPTRLATLSTGSTDALAPESMVSRKPGRRRQLIATTATIAAINAVTTDHMPATAESEVAPNSSLARNDTSRLGRITRVISTLTLTTTRSGNAAKPMDGASRLGWP